MKKLFIKDIIKFRKKSDLGKRNFATTLKLDKARVNLDGGGDYWISCLSAISNSHKLNTLEPVVNKKDDLAEKQRGIENERTKTMYKRNIDILNGYDGFNLKKWRPAKKLTFLKKHKDHSILNINGLKVQVSPHHVFTFQTNEINEIGAIWFIAKLDGFRKEELGMFADILFQYLKSHYSEEYILNTKYCIAVDVFNNFEVSYSQMETEDIPFILRPTLDEIKRLM